MADEDAFSSTDAVVPMLEMDTAFIGEDLQSLSPSSSVQAYRKIKNPPTATMT